MNRYSRNARRVTAPMAATASVRRSRASSGAHSASVPGFAYSGAMKRAQLHWAADVARQVRGESAGRRARQRDAVRGNAWCHRACRVDLLPGDAEVTSCRQAPPATFPNLSEKGTVMGRKFEVARNVVLAMITALEITTLVSVCDSS